LGTPPFPSLADAFYLMFYPLFTLGILLMPVALQSSGEIFTRGDRLTRLLDTGVVTIATSLIIWYFLISPNMEASIEDRMTLALSAIYPVADMLLFFAIVQIIFQKTPINIQGPLIALAISGAILIIADSFFSIMSLQGTFVSGGMVDTAYIAGYTLIGLAGIMQARTPVLLKENRSLCIAAQKEIAERKQAVEAYHLLVDHSLQGLAIFRDGRILFVNQALADMIGYSVEDLLAMPAEQVRSRVHPEDRDLVWNRHMYRMKGEKLPHHYEFRVFRKNGSVAWWEIYATLTEYQGERAVQAAVVDITERKAAEEAILKAKEAADSAARSKSDFLASMSHEIRTPLTSVLGMSELMLDTPLNVEQREFMETIYSSSKSLLSVINDILDFSKIEAHKLALMRQPMDLAKVVEDALDVISPAAANKNLEIICDIDEEVPKEVLGDSGRLKQILVNLIGNAVKFTEKGEVLITASALRQQSKLEAGGIEAGRLDPGKIEIRFAIKDTGIGIPEDRMDRLFQSFSQLDPSITRTYGGTGLGLAICKNLVEMMGGRIWAQTSSGKGSIFYFTIVAEEVPTQDSVVFSHALKGKRLLIAANSDAIQKALSKQAASWGMAATAVSSGAQAIELIKSGDAFDIVILDQALADTDAFKLARMIHEVPERFSTPILMMKSLGNKETSADIIEMLIKPIKPSQLYNALRHALFVVKKEENGMLSAFDSGLARRCPLRILVAEDNPINRKVVTRTLGRMGYRPDIAINGLEVLDALQINRYDLILMDIQMPDMDGIEGTKLIRALHPGGQNPHIVAMTALAMEGDKERCLEAGMDDYLSKPVRMDELVAVLERSSISRKGK
jgi:PAS domain S-box-containing protein